MATGESLRGVGWHFDPLACVVRAAARTDQGPVRTRNEDRSLVARGVFGVADGMGGPGGGDVAAETAVGAFAASVRAGGTVGQATAAAHNAVVRAAREGRGVEGMGTTLCAGAVGWVDGHAAVALAHVGDSRAYAARRGGPLTRLTRDQSYVQDLVDEGLISEQDARHHPRRNVITSAIGTDCVDPVFMIVPAHSGDRILLCSDGVHGVLDDDAIAAVFAGPGSPTTLAEHLVALAIEGGARDNVTAVVVEVLTHRARPTASGAVGLTATA